MERDCQKITDDTGHEWSKDLKDLIRSTIKDRKKAIKQGSTEFGDTYKKAFNEKVDKCIETGWRENKTVSEKYGADFERALRGVKSHMKISGQFESVKAVDNYAIIRTYIETCRRNGINEFDALQRLCAGNPYTVTEIIKESP